MFDLKNISYEHNDYILLEYSKIKILRKNRISNLFIKNNDSLYLYKKYLSYHIRNNFMFLNIDLKTFNINIFLKLKLLLNIFILIYVLKKINIFNYININFSYIKFIFIINKYKFYITKYNSYIKKVLS
jgi:hypothetical protein